MKVTNQPATSRIFIESDHDFSFFLPYVAEISTYLIKVLIK